MNDFDIVVVGGGPAGLISGCYLQKAGLNVAIFEALDEAGSGKDTRELIRPEFLSHPHIWLQHMPYTPYIQDLELYKYGEPGLVPNWMYGKIYDDDTAVMWHSKDYEKTVKNWSKFSEKDAKAYKEFYKYMMEENRGIRLIELMNYRPYTWENFRELMEDVLGPALPFEDPYELMDMTGYEIVELMFESDKIKAAGTGISMMFAYYPYYKGSGAFGTLAGVTKGLWMPYAHHRWGVHFSAHSLIKCFKDLGGDIFTNCPVEKIVVEDGEAKGIILREDSAYPSREISAERGVVSAVSPRYAFLNLVEEKHIDSDIIASIKTNFKDETFLITTSFAMEERPKFSATENHPGLGHTITGRFGIDSWDEVIDWQQQRGAGKLPDKHDLNYLRPHIHDPTHGPGDKTIIQHWDEAPFDLIFDGGTERYDDQDFRDELLEDYMDTWEKYAPGFKDKVIEARMFTPLDHVRKNPSYYKGGWNVLSDGQQQLMFANRSNLPGFDKSLVLTPIENLWNACGNCIDNESGSSGYVTAWVVADMLGIRDDCKSWWKHRPTEWYIQNYAVGEIVEKHEQTYWQ
ncbi:hypothetical protein AKJ61_01340 [candidate division MSBL1 archaeon SCGC-AAA259B11]|uniref:Amine oxidase domain-containing protein n=1 Tax=candidate division MSBL1 archaeon SCGC-AAA259B11 TaxID=1698260 RepID=A0A133U7K3_9EURY|nr:hypothetical protein AKJ61_01340 [candidate division MSBL1 archaeon SCGC-AAA259B11]